MKTEKVKCRDANESRCSAKIPGCDKTQRSRSEDDERNDEACTHCISGHNIHRTVTPSAITFLVLARADSSRRTTYSVSTELLLSGYLCLPLLSVIAEFMMIPSALGAMCLVMAGKGMGHGRCCWPDVACVASNYS